MRYVRLDDGVQLAPFLPMHDSAAHSVVVREEFGSN